MFVARGHRARHFFPHRVIRVRKGGPDGLKLARRMCGEQVRPDELRELVLYALPPVVDELPPDLFFDDDLVWHQQHLGLPGHVATGSVVVQGRDLYVPTLVSDLVQRIGRRRDMKTRVEKVLKGWDRLLINAVLDLALDVGAERVLVATGELAHTHTDPARDVRRPLFERVYDGSVGPPFHAERSGLWWSLDVSADAAAIVRPDAASIPLDDGPWVCVCHDVERGWGHLEEDPAFAARADRSAPEHLDRMLAVEATAGVRATYDVVGFFLPEIAERLHSAGHCVAFHSYDHAGPDEDGGLDQLGRCRQVDYRLKGYRPAQSRLTDELTDDNLALHNFEWLASSRWSFGFDRPQLANGIAHIPICLDDHDLHLGADYVTWEAAALSSLASVPVPVLSLHDCYGDRWLAEYPSLLAKLGDLGDFRTLDQVAARSLLADSF